MSDVMQQITDANGKTINVNISKICDINGDYDNATSTIKDSALKNRINFQHDVKIVNSKGEALDAEKLLNDVNNGQTNITALDVDMEATHSGKNHNYCIYYEDSMEKDAESFMNPFHKPVLKNHDDCCEPIGRIVQSYSGPSELTDERSAIHLKARITDKDAIPKFIDKRYGTVSIGGSMGTVTCNICGKTILKDGKFHFCGHWRGETYKDQVCYWGARDIEYHEVSIVNNPADDFAQIMKVTVLTDKDTNKDNKEESSMGGSDSIENNVDNIIDQTLNSDSETGIEIKDSVQETETQPSQEGNQDNQQQTENQDSNEADSTESVQDNNQDNPSSSTDSNEKDEKDSKIEELSKELEDSKAKIEELNNEIIDCNTQIEALKKNLEDSKNETDNFKQRCVTLAMANKEIVVDGILAKETFANDEAKNNRKNELMLKSMKELKTISEDSKTTTQRTMGSVASPCLAIDNDATKDNKSNGNADTDKTNNQKIITVDDAAQDIINRLLKK